MASQGYRDWIAAGRPYTLIRPARATQATLRNYGLIVYDYPDESHQKADRPQDHTPYSVTGWPGTNRRWNARAIDVMPRNGTAAAKRENADIARQLIRDRDGGHPGAMWIKYLNWTDEDGRCRQERWTDAAQPLKRLTVSSTDKGHIHISGRSDVDNDARADGYDPIARMRNIQPPAQEGDDMGSTDSWAVSPNSKKASFITQNAGRDWLTDQQRDTVLAISAGHAAEANGKLDKVLAQSAEDATRDAATIAAIKALTTGEGTPDAAPIVAAIREEAAKTRQEVEQLHVELRAARQEVLEARQEALGLRKALADALRATAADG